MKKSQIKSPKSIERPASSGDEVQESGESQLNLFHDLTSSSSPSVESESISISRTRSRIFKPLCCFLALTIAASPLPAARTVAQNDELDRLFDEEELEEPPGVFNQAPPPVPPPPPTDFGNVPPATSPGFPSPAPVPSGRPTTRSSPPTSPSTKPGTPVDSRLTMAGAEPEDITNENFPDLIDSFDYPNAEITDVVKAISTLTKRNFIIDPGVRGKISIVAPTQITVAEAYKAFLSALAIHGFTVVPSGKFLKIKSARNAQRDSIETYSGAYYPNSDMMITRIIHLKHISAEEVNKRLLRILPSKDGEFTPYEPTNSVIVSDYGSNIDRIMKIINQLDRPGFEEQLSVVPIRYAKAKDLADLITKIINKGQAPAGGGGGFSPGVPTFRTRGAGSGTPEELSLVAPDDRTNALIVVGNTAGIDKVKSLVKQLDYKLDPSESGGVFVYYVRYGEAEKIAQTLSGITSGGTTGSGSGPTGGLGIPGRPFTPPGEQRAVFGGDVKLVADKNTNALVITASKQDYEIVKNLLAKIDIPRDQVYVEAIIMELNANKTKGWNISYYNLDPGSGGVGRAGFAGGNLTSLLSPVSDTGAIFGFGSGANVKLKLGTTEYTVPSLLAFVNFLQTQTEGNVLSTPQILALDNEEAVIEVGDQIPIGQDTTTAAGGVQTSSTKFEKATIKLTLTPFIRPESEAIRMKIEQIVKQPSDVPIKSESLKASTTTISERTIKSNIVVNNGDTAVLGGLMKDEESLSETKVPVLGDIPVLGWLFKSRKTIRNKINLLVFLTPKIIRNQGDSQKLLSKKANDRVEWIKNNFDGRDPYGKVVDELPRRAEAPKETAVERKKNE